MSNEESCNSLADQAAAWVPPWQRPTPPRQTGDEQPRQEDLGTETPPEGPEVSKIAQDTAVDADADAAAEAEAVDLGNAVPVEGPRVSKIAQDTDIDTDTDTDAGVGGVAGEGAAGRVPKKQPGARRRVVVAPEPAPELDDAELRGALEAILLVVDEPVAEATLAEVLEQPPARVGAMLDQIAAGYTASGYGFELRRAAGGWRLYTRPEYAGYVERFVLEGQSVRLTQAALETLAVVAYKQPVTRSRISAIRGVNCDGVIRTLVTRGLVEECGSEPESGAFLYRTTTLFLEKLGLNTVDELPPLAPFLPDDVEELSDATR
ncbi:SMC-Scp complex subunit ScpB [Micromonospora musae]|uniref:SMC-Scp complex subunit ScpB n=1 Tax=Micromonospora musae TaxID=1894970 RepID=A0A3A9YBI6_9ACTN|nr:SMC-Scp complex subunit ScpB [Micromonospora musae]RKN29107.1 SMC-Scp complex subunit ScpB [Micromonospora musae]